MVIYYTQINVAKETHEKLDRLRREFSDQAYQSPNLLGIGAALAIVIDRFLEAYPDQEWLDAKIREQPKRGRPRTDPRTAEGVARRMEGDQQHVFRQLKENPKVRICTLCSDQYVEGEVIYSCFVARGLRPERKPDPSLYL